MENKCFILAGTTLPESFQRDNAFFMFVLVIFYHFQAPHFTLVKEALIEIGCVVTSLVVGWLSRACAVAKRCILGL